MGLEELSRYIAKEAERIQADLKDLCPRTVGDSSTGLVQTNTSLTNPFFINYTGLSEGTYYFNATANDTLGNEVSTSTKNVSLVKPTLNITKPENKTYISGNNLSLNFTISYGDLIWYNLNSGANTTITGNTTFNTSNGVYILNLYSNNTLGEIVDSISFTINSSKLGINYSNYGGLKKGESTNFNESTYEDLQNLSGIILENIDYGKIQFNQNINVTNDLSPNDNEVDLNYNIDISQNHLEINSTALPNFNKSATLYLYGLTFSNPRILKDGVVCSSPNCVENSYAGGILSFNVTGFTVYSSEETPGTPEKETSGGGGSSGGIRYECYQ